MPHWASKVGRWRLGDPPRRRPQKYKFVERSCPVPSTDPVDRRESSQPASIPPPAARLRARAPIRIVWGVRAVTRMTPSAARGRCRSRCQTDLVALIIAQGVVALSDRWRSTTRTCKTELELQAARRHPVANSNIQRLLGAEAFLARCHHPTVPANSADSGNQRSGGNPDLHVGGVVKCRHPDFRSGIRRFESPTCRDGREQKSAVMDENVEGGAYQDAMFSGSRCAPPRRARRTTAVRRGASATRQNQRRHPGERHGGDVFVIQSAVRRAARPPDGAAAADARRGVRRGRIAVVPADHPSGPEVATPMCRLADLIGNYGASRVLDGPHAGQIRGSASRE